jgi:adenosine deaminase
MQVELHRHLDVCTRPSTLLRLAQERGIEAQSTSLEAFQNKLILRKPMADLNTVLASFSLYQKILDRPEVLERIAFEAVEDCWIEGTRWVEFRYSPLFVSQYGKLSWEDSLAAFKKGIAQAVYRYPDMKAGIICIVGRDEGVELADQVVEFYLNNISSFIGIDLAGPEAAYPCRLFEKSFKKAAAKGAFITIHAGEATGPDSIWEAIELLGARRIGHGVSSIRDPKLMEHLAKHRICLEMCPTSNWLTQSVSQFGEHPLPKLLRAGVPVSINTDDPSIFGTTLPLEFQVCREKMGMTLAEIDKCKAYAYESSFLHGKAH